MLFSPRYNLQLKVDGVEVSNNKAIEYRDHETPYLKAIVNKLVPRSLGALNLTTYFTAMASQAT